MRSPLERSAPLEIFTDPPHGDDSRQAISKRGLAAADQESRKDGWETQSIGMIGFPASRLDLGWLDSKIVSFYEARRPTMDALIEMVDRELHQVIQRLKKCVVTSSPTRGAALLTVELVTKDDHGYYDYGFQVLCEPRPEA